MKNVNILIILLMFLTACGGGLEDAKKVLKNEKIRTTDEFLVKKRKPLVLPPNYDEVLKPNTQLNNNKDENEKEKIKRILNVPKNKNTNNKSSKTEQSILNKIKK